jgi:glycosyltransferase involved in cell wall biosynthesis
MKESKNHIAIFMSFSGDGGVERMIANLCHGMLEAGTRVDLVLARAAGSHVRSIPRGARLFKLGTKHTHSALPGLVSYLRREKPSAILAAKDRAIKTAVLARFFARSDAPLFGRIGTTVSAALEGRSRLRKGIWFFSMRMFFRFTDGIIAVSDGVARDVMEITTLPADRVRVIRNPAVTQELSVLAQEPSPHHWFKEPGIPVITGMGRLTGQKDFSTLIKAFAGVRRNRRCRLIILGEGAQRSVLEALAQELGVEDDIAMPGFVQNPYPYIAMSSLFVLSSRWEGSPNALTEALALGVPVVSTDCASGPREILKNGEYGYLVPVGDAERLGSSMERTLSSPLAPDLLKRAVDGYTVEEATRSYLRVLLGSIE